MKLKQEVEGSTNMDSRKLHYFMEVASASSFTKASEKLRVAQPAISKTIQRLEDEIQLILFDRSDKSVNLTPEGKVLFEYAVEIHAKIEEARRVMEELRDARRGEIRIALPSMFGNTYFIPIVKEFKKLYPFLNVSVMEEATKQIRILMEREEIDFGVIAINPEEPELDVLPLLDDYMVACFPPYHPLAERPSVNLRELLNEQLVLFRDDCLQWDMLYEVGSRAEFEMNVTITTNQLTLIESMVADGVGATLLLNKVIAPNSELSIVPLNPPVPVQLGVCRKKKTFLSKAGETFLDFLKRNIVGESVPAGTIAQASS
ncbi:LysR family transcriptional regulator [Cohnella terricola]|uniref:LysR family transcriptional regulator n=1 Tax=Cohnella terricola TaxID=1289167 RepID=A0A559JJ26_9BACL|nr:LysR family transcriptional regulator [Cohnella terricola]TVX99874.1 LysR family transcriptional regulator [Cohnella terricola]